MTICNLILETVSINVLAKKIEVRVQLLNSAINTHIYESVIINICIMLVDKLCTLSIHFTKYINYVKDTIS